MVFATHRNDGCSACVRLLVAALTLMLAGATKAMLPIQHWQTSAGARVYFVESRSLPMLDVSVELAAGSGFDTPATAGTASLVQHLLRMGAGGLDENAIARRVADVGAQLGGRFDLDRAGVSLRTLSSARERDAALEVLAHVLQRPEFPQAALEREKARTIAGIRDADTRPDTIARRTFAQLVYRDHPYGLRGSGEVATVERIGRAELTRFWRTHYRASRAVVAIIGDVDRPGAERIAEMLTAGLPSEDGAVAELPTLAGLATAVERRIDHPSSQSHIVLGAPAIRRGHPDFFPLMVGNHVLGGGGFASRLNDEVRQKRGLAYSVGSGIAPLGFAGHFQIGLQTVGEQAGEALGVVRSVLADFVARGPSEAELAAARDNIVGGFPLRIDTNREILEHLALIGFYRLPLTYLQDFVANVEKVTAADIRAAFARHVRPEAMVTVVVGGQSAAGQ